MFIENIQEQGSMNKKSVTVLRKQVTRKNPLENVVIIRPFHTLLSTKNYSLGENYRELNDEYMACSITV